MIVDSCLEENRTTEEGEGKEITLTEIADCLENNEETPARNFQEAISCCTKVDRSVFFKGCKWSPDDLGNRILTCDGSNKLTIFHTFLNKFNYKSSQISDDKYELSNVGNIYDFDWFPLVSVSQYYVSAATSLGPIHIFDLSNSKSIASYQMYNTNDEITYAHSVTCAPDGSRLIAGTSDYVFVFDTNRPGRTYQMIKTRPHFRRGIISTITVNPHRPSMFAVGSYNNRIGVFDDTSLLCMLNGHTKGVSHVKFSPDGLLLYSGTRGNGDIVCWDLRNPGTALYKLERLVKTQQRIYFDISSNCRYIFSGSTTGNIYIWDSLASPLDDVLPPLHIFEAHQDCANGVSIHNQLPFLVTVSGQYHSDLIDPDEDNDGSEGNVDRENAIQENSLKLWHIEL